MDAVTACLTSRLNRLEDKTNELMNYPISHDRDMKLCNVISKRQCLHRTVKGNLHYAITRNIKNTIPSHITYCNDDEYRKFYVRNGELYTQYLKNVVDYVNPYH
jgi:hypothetical protein